MTWWLHIRHVRLVLATTLAFWLLCAALGNTALPLPQLGGATSADVPLLLLFPVMPAIALNSAHPRVPVIEATATRRVSAADAALALAVVALCAVLAVPLFAGWVPGPDSSATADALRNLAFYTGLALLGRALLGGHASTVLPVATGLIVATFGYGPEHQAHWWAWPAADPAEPLSWIGTSALLAAGLRITVRQDRPRSALPPPR